MVEKEVRVNLSISEAYIFNMKCSSRNVTVLMIFVTGTMT